MSIFSDKKMRKIVRIKGEREKKVKDDTTLRR